MPLCTQPNTRSLHLLALNSQVQVTTMKKMTSDVGYQMQCTNYLKLCVSPTRLQRATSAGDPKLMRLTKHIPNEYRRKKKWPLLKEPNRMLHKAPHHRNTYSVRGCKLHTELELVLKAASHIVLNYKCRACISPSV